MKVVIRNHEFRINCGDEDRDDMRIAATLIDKQLERVRTQYGISDSERSALVAGLMVAFEIKKAHNGMAVQTMELDQAQAIAKAMTRIDEVLERTDFSAKA